jgi:hypothetical protein
MTKGVETSFPKEVRDAKLLRELPPEPLREKEGAPSVSQPFSKRN